MSQGPLVIISLLSVSLPEIGVKGFGCLAYGLITPSAWVLGLSLISPLAIGPTGLRSSLASGAWHNADLTRIVYQVLGYG